METPSDKAGYYTEYTLALVRTNVEVRGEVALTTGQYNAVYEAVYNGLKKAGIA